MLVGVMTLELYLPWVHSLKEKRKEMTSLIRRIQHKFSLSVAESDYQSLHQRGEISIAFLTNHPNQGDSIMDHVLNYIESNTQGSVTVTHREYR